MPAKVAVSLTLSAKPLAWMNVGPPVQINRAGFPESPPLSIQTKRAALLAISA